MSLTLAAPAKLNLMLHIVGRRDDGYHLLQTAIQFIDLCDRITISATTDGKISRAESDTPVAADDDIALAAARALQQACAVRLGACIAIDKCIPIGAGLGGGSSDAATVLLALNKLWRLGLGLAELASIGLGLGADVPVFIGGKAAWAEGVGEELSPVDFPERQYLVIYPGIMVPTGEIFNAEELTRNSDAITIRAFLEGVGKNVCEPVVCGRYPEVRAALDWLNQFAEARLTGTGACVFAPFDSLEQAEGVKSRAPAHWKCFAVSAMNRNPVLQQLEY